MLLSWVFLVANAAAILRWQVGEEDIAGSSMSQYGAVGQRAL